MEKSRIEIIMKAVKSDYEIKVGKNREWMNRWIRRGYIKGRGKDGVWLMEETGKERRSYA